LLIPLRCCAWCAPAPPAWGVTADVPAAIVSAPR
jgi:hypothetical protein